MPLWSVLWSAAGATISHFVGQHGCPEIMPLQLLHANPIDDYTLGAIERSVRFEGGRWVADFAGLTLYSHFQAIVSPAHRRRVGCEALLRSQAPDGRAVSPADVFSIAQAEAAVVYLDRLTRYLNVRNFVQQGDASGWLFLNINSVAITRGKHYGMFFAEMLERCGIPPHRIVVEILENEVQDEERFVDAVRYYRDLGCLIAIDDFGRGHSNIERIWRLRPDIVKLDRSLIQQSAVSPGLRRTMPGLVGLLHQSGCMVLSEGIETPDEATIAMDADVDFVQGYYFARPCPSVTDSTAVDAALTRLWKEYKAASLHGDAEHNSRLAPYRRAMEEAASLLQAGHSFEEATRSFLALPLADRCYLLDETGAQVGPNLSCSDRNAVAKPQFDPIADPAGADWSRRHYFRRAITDMERTQVTRPYLSIAGARQCITVSRFVYGRDGKCVVCGDVDWL